MNTPPSPVCQDAVNGAARTVEELPHAMQRLVDDVNLQPGFHALELSGLQSGLSDLQSGIDDELTGVEDLNSAQVLAGASTADGGASEISASLFQIRESLG